MEKIHFKEKTGLLGKAFYTALFLGLIGIASYNNEARAKKEAEIQNLMANPVRTIEHVVENNNETWSNIVSSYNPTNVIEKVGLYRLAERMMIDNKSAPELQKGQKVNVFIYGDKK